MTICTMCVYSLEGYGKKLWLSLVDKAEYGWDAVLHWGINKLQGKGFKTTVSCMDPKKCSGVQWKNSLTGGNFLIDQK